MAEAVTFVVMGPSGCGKSSLGSEVAAKLGRPFIEGDELHLPRSIEKMSQGVSLTDQDRWPWIDRVAQMIKQHATDGSVVACSALKRSYRDRLRAHSGAALTFFYLDVDRDELNARLAGRAGHYMRAELLDSQLATLEVPAADEPACRLDGSLDIATLTAQALEFVARSS